MNTISINPELVSSELLTKEAIERAQVAVYVMVGGGIIGRFAAESPAEFYVDDRATTRYPKGQVVRAVKYLVALAEASGLDPKNMPMPRFHNLGVF
mgnify:CR=1 FL=1